MADPIQTTRFRFWLWLIRVIGAIAPRRLRANWRREWEVEAWLEEPLGGQDGGVERLESDIGMASAQGAMGPFAFKLAEHVLPFRDGQASPFYLGRRFRSLMARP